MTGDKWIKHDLATVGGKLTGSEEKGQETSNRMAKSTHTNKRVASFYDRPCFGNWMQKMFKMVTGRQIHVTVTAIKQRCDVELKYQLSVCLPAVAGYIEIVNAI